jgi:hypothetical protein
MNAGIIQWRLFKFQEGILAKKIKGSWGLTMIYKSFALQAIFLFVNRVANA